MYEEKVHYLLHISSTIPSSEPTHVNCFMFFQMSQLAYSNLYKHSHEYREIFKNVLCSIISPYKIRIIKVIYNSDKIFM